MDEDQARRGDMRQLIHIVEGSETANKPLTSVTVDDVIRACFDEPDILDVMHSGWWSNYISQSDQVPQNAASISPAQWQVLRREMSEMIAEAQRLLAPLGKARSIVIKRHVKRLDLSWPLGTHWSIAKAKNLTTEQFGNVVLLGTVAPKDINWAATVAHSIFFHDEEAEITVHSGAEIKLKQIRFLDGMSARA